MTTDKLVAVVWKDPKVDATAAYTRDEILSRHVPHWTTIGVLVRDDAEVVAIANEVGEDGVWRGVTYVLRPLVLDIVPISRWPKRKRARNTIVKGDAA
jgi:hypothetical protein